MEMFQWPLLHLFGLALLGLVVDAANVQVEMFVASKCPDASRCENAFMPEVLARVGSIVDLRLNYIGEANVSAPYGVSCMHGDSECEGNAAQLCVREHFPPNRDIGTLGKHSWTAFLRCVGGFNRTTDSQIPGNTDACLSSLGVPADTVDRIHDCIEGVEGRRLLVKSVQRTSEVCGRHTKAPRRACKSCTIFLEGRRACVRDDGEWYNCSLGHDVQAWTGAICSAYNGATRPLACNVVVVPRVVGHSYGSVDPSVSADFVVRYFGAQMLRRSPSEVEVQMPSFDDYRGGGLLLRFARTPGAPGGPYDLNAFVRSMNIIAGNLSDNTGYQWNQFFENHLGFYLPGQSALAERFLREYVPFFTGIDGGYYQSLYVMIPGTGSIVEILGNFVTRVPIPASSIRIESTQQFCTPFHGHGMRPGPALGRSLRIQDTEGADMNKTTLAAPDPEAVVRFAVMYLGASPVHQRRGPQANGQCATLAWARWPDGHEWHVVYTFSTDWVVRDQVGPEVPYNVSGFASYVERFRNFSGGYYDQYLDYREILEVDDLAVIEARLSADNVPLLHLASSPDGSQRLVAAMPGGLAVELRQRKREMLDNSAMVDSPAIIREEFRGPELIV